MVTHLVIWVGDHRCLPLSIGIIVPVVRLGGIWILDVLWFVPVLQKRKQHQEQISPCFVYYLLSDKHSYSKLYHTTILQKSPCAKHILLGQEKEGLENS